MRSLTMWSRGVSCLQARKSLSLDGAGSRKGTQGNVEGRRECKGRRGRSRGWRRRRGTGTGGMEKEGEQDVLSPVKDGSARGRLASDDGEQLLGNTLDKWRCDCDGWEVVQPDDVAVADKPNLVLEAAPRGDGCKAEMDRLCWGSAKAGQGL
ncbi:hypothetical protein L1887_57701 [Cichorium endivia]|nr:hypothetical protein L1887_57701 [Cichorium endivia]